MRQLVRKFRRRHRSVRSERGIIDHAARLIGHRLGDLVAAIADIDAPQTANAVEILVAFGIDHMRPVRFRQDQRAVFLKVEKSVHGWMW